MVIRRLSAVLVNVTDIPRVRSWGASRRSSSANDRGVFGQRTDALTLRVDVCGRVLQHLACRTASSSQARPMPRCHKAAATTESSSEVSRRCPAVIAVGRQETYLPASRARARPPRPGMQSRPSAVTPTAELKAARAKPPDQGVQQCAQDRRTLRAERPPEFALGTPAGGSDRRQVQEDTAVGQVVSAHEFVDPIQDDRPLGVDDVPFIVRTERRGPRSRRRSPAGTGHRKARSESR